MIDLEIPLKKRSTSYRFFEMVPALLSYGSIILLIVLSLWSPLLAAVYLFLIITTMLVKAVGIAVHMISGQQQLKRAQTIDWHARLEELEDPVTAYEKHRTTGGRAKESLRQHIENLRIRLPRGMRHQASTVGRSIVEDVATHIATATSGRTGAIRIDEIAAGRVKNSERAGELAAKKVGGMLNDRSRK